MKNNFSLIKYMAAPVVSALLSGFFSSSSYAFTDPSALSVGEWRILSERSLFNVSRFKSVVYDPIDNAIEPSYYNGTDDNHWRFVQSSSGYKIKSESTGQCLSDSSTGQVTLNNCNEEGITWNINEIRKGNTVKAGKYRLVSSNGRCLDVSQPFIFQGDITTTSTCSGASTTLFIEPVGWGERNSSVTYSIKGLLLIKKYTNIPGFTEGEISDAAIDNLKTAYTEHLPQWISRITDGKVNYIPEVIVSTDPIVALDAGEEAGGNHLPSAEVMQEDVNSLIARGQYDVVQVAFTSGNNSSVTGGWGWGPGPSVFSKNTLWTTIHATLDDGSQRFENFHGDLNTRSEPVEVFIHEPMHGFDQYMEMMFGSYALPTGQLHGSSNHGYSVNPEDQTSYLHWFRDYWLGKVLGADGVYKGYGERLFNAVKVKDWALSEPVLEYNFQHSGGKCISTDLGDPYPENESTLRLAGECSTLGQSFKFLENGSILHVSSGQCVHPQGGEAGIGIPLVLWPSCEDANGRLQFEFTLGGSIRHVKSGYCVHPEGGSATPNDGTRLVLWSGCDDQRLEFNEEVRY